MAKASRKAVSREALVQTRLSPDLKMWVTTLAEKNGLSVAAWLRSHLTGLRALDESSERVLSRRASS